MTEQKLWCHIEGQRNCFKVSISPLCDVYDLKKQILTEGSSETFVGCKAMDLTLTKVDSGEYRPWPEQPPRDHVSVFVSLPGGTGSPILGDAVELGAHGYEVEPRDGEDEKGNVWMKLDKMPSHILTVYRRSDPSKKFIAKKVHEESNELDILKHLNTTWPKSKHIISLHEWFQTQSTLWVILPKMVTLTGCRLHGKVAQVCWGLIEGVAYLHKLFISHGDIKPSNLVVDSNFS
ncbi:hypothetical protein BGY98DRAFT_931338 [Russula aff. rugulosa BPL654]|nr:hypothetical protein BGY98DRAFT_931338 [Russula aff. rugulosa BPL654]